MTGKREYGDYQTPADFAGAVCDFLFEKKALRPQVVIEPTCGVGNFLKRSLVFEADEYIGIEINPEYCSIARERISDKRVKISNEDFFKSDILKSIRDETLVLGNPPWVTNSTLTYLNSDNIPQKSNFKNAKGLDAITGSSNFDICEYIIDGILTASRGKAVTIAMLCKTSVARNVFMQTWREGVGCESFELYDFDAQKVFSVHTQACLLLIKISKDALPPARCHVYDFSNPEKKKYSFGFVDGAFYSNIEEVGENDLWGESCFEWRQGVKHDCSKVMELTRADDRYFNGYGNEVEIEDTYVYPLIKSSMFKSPIIEESAKRVIVTQRKSGDDTREIQYVSPLLWQYLQVYKADFAKRKSSVYKNAPDFAMFGVGEYSYSPYKVGISGFYKTPFFALLKGNSRPLMSDDTVYFISFDTYEMAYVAMLCLNSRKVRDFLKKISFADSKRPYTKKILSRIDFRKLIEAVPYAELQNTERSLNLSHYVSLNMYEAFCSVVRRSSLTLV